MIIDIDLNDTLMNSRDAICLASKGKLQPSDFTVWDTPFGDKLQMTDRMAQEWAYQNPELQMAARPNERAKEAMDWLKEHNIFIRIVTATCLEIDQIVEWLERYNLPFDDVIKSANKISSNLLIDDSPTTIKARNELGLETIAFSQAWNRDQPGDRLYNWYDLPDKII